MQSALADRSVPVSLRIESFLTAVAKALVADDYCRGCAVAATVLGASGTSPALREGAASGFSS